MRTRLAVGLGVVVTLAGLCVVTGCHAPEESETDVREAETSEAPTGFVRVGRPGAVDIETSYDLSGLSIPKDQIHTLLPRDAIPALTDPPRQALTEAGWLPPEARIVVVRTKTEVLGVPLRVLNWHEIVNTTVGGVPVAVTYCPLCDSAAVFDRRVKSADGATETLEFGVSGALYNSNVLMYDTAHKGLWSQYAMEAVSGPYAGTSLRSLPIELVSLGVFSTQHPGAEIVSDQTGVARDYSVSPYDSFFADDGLMVPVSGVGDALAKKTLGVAVEYADRSWFVPATLIGDNGYTLETPAGGVTMTRSDAGVRVTSAPETVRTMQGFYYSWSAFHPDGNVVTE